VHFLLVPFVNMLICYYGIRKEYQVFWARPSIPLEDRLIVDLLVAPYAHYSRTPTGRTSARGLNFVGVMLKFCTNQVWPCQPAVRTSKRALQAV
jgi:hypothetical protein